MSTHRLIRAIYKQPLDRTPVWIMRQAGRYLPEYRKIRNSVKDFLSLCKNPELAAEVTLQPITRFDLDAAIIFSDILTIPDAYGLELHFEENLGPIFNKPIRSEQDIKRLPKIDPNIDLKYVMDAIRLTCKSLQGKKPLIGFSGSPWTLACYMIEGQSSKQFSIIKRFLYQNKAQLHLLLQHLSDSIVDYLYAQITAGVEVVMIFDTWGGILDPDHFRDFSLHYMKDIIEKLRTLLDRAGKKIPIILFTKSAGLMLRCFEHSKADVIGLDWTISLDTARKMVGQNFALQGNLDPACLYADESTIDSAVKNILQGFGMGSGHIFNLGHGILPDTDPYKLAHMLDVLKEVSPQFHPKNEGQSSNEMPSSI